MTDTTDTTDKVTIIVEGDIDSIVIEKDTGPEPEESEPTPSRGDDLIAFLMGLFAGSR